MKTIKINYQKKKVILLLFHIGRFLWLFIWGDLNFNSFFLLVYLFFFFLTVSRILFVLAALYSSAFFVLLSSVFFVWSLVFSELPLYFFLLLAMKFFMFLLLILQKDFLDRELSIFYFISGNFFYLDPRVLNL